MTISLNPQSLAYWQEHNLEPLRYQYKVNPEDTIIDIGSYRREWGSEMVKMYGCQCEYFDALDNRAAWTHDGVLQFGGAYYYTSIFEQANTEYKCVDIAPFLQKEIAVLKINIEGGEWKLLPYIISKGLMKNVRYLQVQFHLIENTDCEEAYKIIAQLLSLTHKLDWRYPFVWESWSRREDV